MIVFFQMTTSPATEETISVSQARLRPPGDRPEAASCRFPTRTYPPLSRGFPETVPVNSMLQSFSQVPEFQHSKTLSTAV